MSEADLEYYRDKYSKDSEILILLDKYSKLLKENCSEILQGKLDILPEVRKLRLENDKKHNCGTNYF